jgi:drug/metabolite transporter (DMT)-like permease
MEEILNPQQSLEIIQRTIAEAKTRFQENGLLYIFWGALIAFCAIAQFVMESQHVPYAFAVWFLTILGFFITFIYFYRKNRNVRRGKNIISEILSSSGIIVGVNISLLGFCFWMFLGSSFIPIVVIFLSFYTMIIGKALQFRQMFISGLISNVLGFALFFVPLQYQPLGLAAVAIFLLLIPGILLNRMNAK